jgi:hypothetical protein
MPAAEFWCSKRAAVDFCASAAAGNAEVLASGIKQPRAIAVAPDGHIWIATEDTVARFEEGRLDVFAGGFVDVQAIAVDRSTRTSP